MPTCPHTPSQIATSTEPLRLETTWPPTIRTSEPDARGVVVLHCVECDLTVGAMNLNESLRRGSVYIFEGEPNAEI